MGDRKRVKKVEVNDFRAYNGRMNFDFTTKSGEVADLIAIYAPNGVGKTSFFDAIEWGITGKVDRLENDIGDDNYRGYILKNRDSLAENANVKIQLENDGFITRKTRRLTDKQLQDYTSGYKKAYNKDVFNFQNWESLILSHNRIESFVKDNTGAKKYDYWGSYWDPTGREREKFEFLYKMKKQAQSELEKINLEIESNKLKLEKFKNTVEFVNNINKYIKKFNEFVNKKEKIKYINSEFSNKEYSLLINEIESKRKEIQYTIEQYEKRINDLNIFDTAFINSFKDSKRELEYNKQMYEYWGKILLKANEKVYLINQLNIIKDKLTFNNNKLNILSEIYNLGDKWFKLYEDYKTNNLFIDSILKKRKEIDDQLLYNNGQILVLSEKYDELISKNNIEVRKKKLSEYLKFINKLDRNTKLNEKWWNKFTLMNDRIEKMLNLEEIDKESIEECFIKDINNFSIIQLSLKSPSFKEKDEIIVELEDRLSNRKELENNIHIEEEKYKLSQDLSKELANIINIARSYISREKIKKCPVCNSEYESTKELILRTNSDGEDSIQVSLNKSIQYKDELKEKLIEIDETVKKWNEFIRIISIDNEKKINKYRNYIKRIGLIKEEIDKAIINNKKASKRFLNEIRSLEYYDAEISTELIEKWYYKQIDRYNKTKQELETKISNVKNEKEKNNLLLDNILKEYELKKISINVFESSAKNLEFIDFIKKNNINDDINIFKKEIVTIDEKNSELRQELNKINEKLNILSWVDDSKIIYYKNRTDIFYKNYNEKTLQYNYISSKIKNIIGKNVISKKIIDNKINKLRSGVKKSNLKINSISNIQFSSEIQEYLNSREEIEKELNDLLNKANKYKGISEKLENLYLDAKKIIEDKITTILNTPLMNDFYKKIEPHPIMKNIKYSLKFNDKDKPELEMLVVSEKEEYTPEWYFSSAQLNVVALTTFFGRANSVQSSPIDTIFIDDPVGHFDDLNILAFVDLLRAIIEKKQKQVIISTHDELVYRLLKRKLPEEYYPTKFIELDYRD